MPEGFPPVHVRQVHFDERHAGGGQRVAQRDAGVGEGGRVDDDEGHLGGARPLCPVHQLALVIGLERLEPQALLIGQRLQVAIDVSQSSGAIHGRLTRAEHVEVRAMQHPDQLIHRR